MQYTHVPAAQASAMSDNSETDGELGRTEFYGKNHPKLTRVEEPHLEVHFCVYSRHSFKGAMNWETLLQTSEGTIGHVRGVEKISSALKGLSKGRVYIVNNTLSGLKMLAEGRLEYFIGPETDVDPILKRETFIASLHKSIPLESHRAHAYLNIRHKELAPQLSRTLQEMKAEGLLESYAKRCDFRP